MITADQYCHQHCLPDEVPIDVRAAAEVLLAKVNALLADPACPSPDAGLRSGYRPPSFNTTVRNAAPNSKHMTGHAVDLDDGDEALDDWLTVDLLVQYELYREHPDATKSWCHLQDIAPGSGRRTFYP